jgi:hypothetical protein
MGVFFGFNFVNFMRNYSSRYFFYLMTPDTMEILDKYSEKYKILEKLD